MSPILYSLRYAAAKLERGNPFRKAAVSLLKGLKGERPRLPANVIYVRPLDMPEVSFAAVDSMVMEAVYWFGVRGYEGVMSEVWQELCADSRGVLEIGANVGLYSVIGARKTTASYTAIEPLPEVAALVRANLERNGIKNVRVIEGAAIAGEEEKTVYITVPDEHHAVPVGAHLIDDVEVSNRSSLKTIAVRGLPIGSLLQGKDLIKIDAEGIEAQLLMAAHEAIRRDKPTLVIEVLPEAEKLGAVLSKLAMEVGYVIHVVPAYRSDEIIHFPAEQFTSKIPSKYHSKDVVLSLRKRLLRR
jgi:FkbM family methyltransferase